MISWCILHQWCRPVPIKVGVNGAVPGSDLVPSGLRDLTSGQTVHDCAMMCNACRFITSSPLLYLWCKDVFSIFFAYSCIFTLQVAGPKPMNSPLWCIPFKSILLRYGRDDMIVQRCWRVLNFKLRDPLDLQVLSQAWNPNLESQMVLDLLVSSTCQAIDMHLAQSEERPKRQPTKLPVCCPFWWTCRPP